jgi:hypothetical protein
MSTYDGCRLEAKERLREAIPPLNDHPLDRVVLILVAHGASAMGMMIAVDAEFLGLMIRGRTASKA